MSKELSISDLFEPGKISVREKKFGRRVFTIMIVLTIIMTSLITFFLQSGDFITNNVVMVISVILTIIFASPVLTLLTRMFKKEANFNESFTVLTTSMTYGLLFLLLTSPLFIVLSFNGMEEFFILFFIISIATSGIMFFKLIRNTFKLSFFKTLIVASLVGIYTLFLFVNIPAVLLGIFSQPYYEPISYIAYSPVETVRSVVA